MSTIDTRREQMFPKLEPHEIDRLRRFGTVQRYAAGEAIFVTGEVAPGMAVQASIPTRLPAPTRSFGAVVIDPIKYPDYILQSKQALYNIVTYAEFKAQISHACCTG
jgi:hypothetical protein